MTTPAEAGTAPGGKVEIPPRVVESIAAHAVGDGSGRARFKSATATGSEQCSLTIDIAALWPNDLPALARDVAGRAAREVTALTGKRVTSVEVRITEVLQGSSGRVR